MSRTRCLEAVTDTNSVGAAFVLVVEECFVGVAVVSVQVRALGHVVGVANAEDVALVVSAGQVSTLPGAEQRAVTDGGAQADQVGLDVFVFKRVGGVGG